MERPVSAVAQRRHARSLLGKEGSRRGAELAKEPAAGLLEQAVVGHVGGERPAVSA